ADGGAAVRFDGVDDCLGATGPHLDLDEFTVFVLAAPRSNAGSFRAFFSASATGKNDYQTGLNIDQGGAATEQFSQLNVEGKNFGGMVNLMTEPQRFGEFHVLAVRGKTGKGGVQLFVDGKPAGKRDRAPGPIRLDQITLGARFYSNTLEAPSWRDFLDGDIAEVLLYRRAVGDDELKAVNGYLGGKVAGLNKVLAGMHALSGRATQPLVLVKNPPPVQMFVPGF